MSSNVSLRRTHSAKPFQCAICKRDFARLEHLKRHRTTHTNEKAYVCFCGKAFARRDLLKRHEQNGRHLVTTPSEEGSPNISEQPVESNNGVQHLDAPNVSNESQQFQVEGYQPLGNDGVEQSHPVAVPDEALQNLFFPDAFYDFSTFIDTMGLQSGIDFLYDPGIDWTHHSSTTGNLYESSHNALHSRQENATLTATNTAVSYNPRIRPMEDDFEELGPVPCRWKIHEDQINLIQITLSPFQDHLSGFRLPSRLMLSRYITGYFDIFQNHLPFIHAATFTPAQFYKYPGLFLAMAAIGAMYRYETRTATQLFHAAKEVVLRTWHDEARTTEEVEDPVEKTVERLRTVQAAVLVVDFAVCQCHLRSTKDILTLQSLLAGYIRESSTVTSSSHKQNETWHDWLLHEGHCRTQLAIFCVLNLYTVYFDTPPIALSSQLDLDLPCSTAEWTAPTAAAWNLTRSHSTQSAKFQHAFSALFSKSTIDQGLNYSPFANLILIHALLQRIYLARQMHTEPSGSLRAADVDEINLALKQWTLIWKQAPESILDLANPDGSNCLASTSCLGLARIRLYSDYGHSRRMSTWDPLVVARTLFDVPPLGRTEDMTLALLHSAHALNLLVKFGMQYISRQMFLRWENSNLLYYLEAAVFLSKWLDTMARTQNINHATEVELKIVGIVIRIVEEAALSLEPHESLGHIYTLRDLEQGNLVAICQGLSIQVARSWTIVFSNSGSPWAITKLVGRTLASYADMVEKDVLYMATPAAA